MPVLLPTPDELATMSWRDRLAARKVIDAYVATYGAPTKKRRTAVPVENVAFGARVRHLAREMEAGRL